MSIISPSQNHMSPSSSSCPTQRSNHSHHWDQIQLLVNQSRSHPISSEPDLFNIQHCLNFVANELSSPLFKEKKHINCLSRCELAATLVSALPTLMSTSSHSHLDTTLPYLKKILYIVLPYLYQDLPAFSRVTLQLINATASTHATYKFGFLLWKMMIATIGNPTLSQTQKPSTSHDSDNQNDHLHQLISSMVQGIWSVIANSILALISVPQAGPSNVQSPAEHWKAINYYVFSLKHLCNLQHLTPYLFNKTFIQNLANLYTLILSLYHLHSVTMSQVVRAFVAFGSEFITNEVQFHQTTSTIVPPTAKVIITDLYHCLKVTLSSFVSSNMTNKKNQPPQKKSFSVLLTQLTAFLNLAWNLDSISSMDPFQAYSFFTFLRALLFAPGSPIQGITYSPRIFKLSLSTASLILAFKLIQEINQEHLLHEFQFTTPQFHTTTLYNIVKALACLCAANNLQLSTCNVSSIRIQLFLWKQLLVFSPISVFSRILAEDVILYLADLGSDQQLILMLSNISKYKTIISTAYPNSLAFSLPDTLLSSFAGRIAALLQRRNMHLLIQHTQQCLSNIQQSYQKHERHSYTENIFQCIFVLSELQTSQCESKIKEFTPTPLLEMLSRNWTNLTQNEIVFISFFDPHLASRVSQSLILAAKIASNAHTTAKKYEINRLLDYIIPSQSNQSSIDVAFSVHSILFSVDNWYCILPRVCKLQQQLAHHTQLGAVIKPLSQVYNSAFAFLEEIQAHQSQQQSDQKQGSNNMHLFLQLTVLGSATQFIRNAALRDPTREFSPTLKTALLHWIDLSENSFESNSSRENIKQFIHTPDTDPMILSGNQNVPNDGSQINEKQFNRAMEDLLKRVVDFHHLQRKCLFFRQDDSSESNDNFSNDMVLTMMTRILSGVKKYNKK